MLSVNSYLRSTRGFLADPLKWLKQQPLLMSSMLFFMSTTLVNLGNYVFNLIFGRWLGPALFADLSVIVTLMLVSTFATTAFMTATARFAASYTIGEHMHLLAALRSWLGRWALAIGCAVALFLISGASFLAQLFHMHSFWPFIVLGIGLPLFFVLAVDRGILQGQARFVRLAASNQAEMWIRLLGAVIFVVIGWSVSGAVWGLTLSFVAGWLVSLAAAKGLPQTFQPLSLAEKAKIIRYFGPVIIGLIGQIIINNSDVLIVKSFFPPEQAGQYAALALIGRMVFFATWSVVVVMFPVVTQRHERGEKHRFLLWLSLGIITLVSSCIVVLTLFIPRLLIGLLFGPAYLPIAPLLWLYALATAFYALANVIVNYHLSLGNGGGSYFVLLAGVLQIIGLLLWHDTLLVIVLVQVVVMVALLLIFIVYDFVVSRQTSY